MIVSVFYKMCYKTLCLTHAQILKQYAETLKGILGSYKKFSQNDSFLCESNNIMKNENKMKINSYQDCYLSSKV